MPVSITITLFAAAVLAAALWFAQRWQQRKVAALVDTLEHAARATASAGYELQGRDTLPPPVRRYLDHVLGAQTRHLRLARYEQRGTLRTSTSSERWMDFTASQFIAPLRTQFIWDAQVIAMPFLHLRVLDSLIEGRGAGQVSLLSAIPVANALGNSEMNSGALHRFLAEAVWYPTALLPSAHLRWEPIDETRALATLSNGDTCVSLEFRFNAQNEVTGIYTPGRWGSFDGGYQQLPWEGRFGEYMESHGLLVPASGEVGWHTGGQWHAVWRGVIVESTLEFE